MHINDIIDNLRKLNGTKEPAAKPKQQKVAAKAKAPAKAKANGHTVFDADEALRISLQRLINAFQLQPPVTAESMFDKVKEAETKYEGVVQ